MAGARPSGRPLALSSLSSFKVFASAVLTLLSLAALSSLLSSQPPGEISAVDPSSVEISGEGPTVGVRRTFLALKSDPLRTRLHLVRRQAADHAALASYYAALARRLKLASHQSLLTFSSLQSSLLSVSSSLSSLPSPLDEDSLRPLEKQAKDTIKSARTLISESKESFDTQLKIQKLRDTIFAVQEQLNRAKKLNSISSFIAASSTPKSLHCLAMRLMEHRIQHPKRRVARLHPALLADPDRIHLAVFSDNVIAVSVVVNSAIRNSNDPSKLIFHIVTDTMYLAAFQVWFDLRPVAGKAHVDVRSVKEFGALGNSTGEPVGLEWLRFYLPEMYPGLRRILYLEDDVVVQRDLEGLWRVDLEGKVNGAVEMCFGGFQRFGKYLNFSEEVVRERFNPRACAWGYGVNVFDLDAWRREQCTDKFHEFQSLNKDGTLWNSGAVLPAGLMTFYTATKPLDKSWHVMGLGYNPSVSQDEIRRAAIIHFNGNMKPWLDVAMNQYKNLWTKYVDTEMEFLQLCNFGL